MRCPENNKVDNQSTYICTSCDNVTPSNRHTVISNVHFLSHSRMDLININIICPLQNRHILNRVDDRFRAAHSLCACTVRPHKLNKIKFRYKLYTPQTPSVLLEIPRTSRRFARPRSLPVVRTIYFKT